MNIRFSLMVGVVFAAAATAVAGRTVTVAQSGHADVVGHDDQAIQKAVRLLKSGDTLAIGPGTYRMENSVFIPSNITVRGEAGKTILAKGPGVDSPLEEDGDYGETPWSSRSRRSSARAWA